MATKSSMAIRRDTAWDQITQASLELTSSLEMTGEYFGAHSKDPEMKWTLDLEEFARFMEDLVVKIKEHLDSVVQEHQPPPVAQVTSTPSGLPVPTIRPIQPVVKPSRR